MVILWTFLIVFGIVGFLFRKPRPRPAPIQLHCPYCKRPATRITFSYDCSDCGQTVIGSADLSQSGEVEAYK
jgi:hypothetical protein